MSSETIKNKITELIGYAGYTPEDVEVTFDENTNTLWFSIKSGNTRLLLGRDAEALSALNHLATKVVEKLAVEGVNHPRVIIDANDFERKKIDNLKTVAHMMAERARYFKSSVSVDPMPAHQRKARRVVVDIAELVLQRRHPQGHRNPVHHPRRRERAFRRAETGVQPHDRTGPFRARH